MESDAGAGTSGVNRSPEESQALNTTILDYYKKFGRKRDLEQYFSLNTAQGDIKDVSSLFWRRMKSQESSDSGEKSQDTSLEVCRIQIKCSTVDIDPTSSQEENPQSKSDSESPPIITEEAPKSTDTRQSDDEPVETDDEKSVKSDGNNSQKSNDAILDTSINKAYSPSSSITSQRKLEWDSLADVGYANESDKRTTASSLSTLERLALKQQYSNNDTHQDNLMGPPTAHSTPVEEIDMKSKGRKGSKSTKIYRRDVDCVEVNVPQCTDTNPPQSINVNLTKHISFSVDKGGAVSVENVKRDYSLSPDKGVEIKPTSHKTIDKEIQTSLIKTTDKCSSSSEIPLQLYGQGVPVLINLNNLKKRQRRKKVTVSKKKLRIRKKLDADKENVPILEKSGEQVSEAESFEYMPGHIYNQNQLNREPSRSNQAAGNKSSLESSGAATTDSSKGSKHSFTKDLENSIKLLRSALNKRYDDTELKQKLIKEVVQRLLKSNYRDDESTTDFLSGLSFSSKKLGLSGNNTTSSTSDANNTAEKGKLTRPKKSILRVEKFNSNDVASTSQSAPNLPVVSNSENPVSTNLSKVLTTSNSSSNSSSKEKTSSDTAFAKTSSEELYQKYLEALRREEAYKKHLRDKEQFLKQKLVASDTAFRTTPTPSLTGQASRLDIKSRLKLKELMKDLTRNNYDDGSGDASKLEGGLASDVGLISIEGRNQRRHSVFTLSSSGNSEQSKKSNLKKSSMKDAPKAGNSKNEKHYCCCPHHSSNRIGVSDSSVQVNLKCEDGPCLKNNDNVATGPPCPTKSTAHQPLTHIVSDDNTGDIKYLCLCSNEVQNSSDNFLIYKCSRLDSKTICCKIPELPKTSTFKLLSEVAKPSKSSQTCIKIPDSSSKQKEQLCIHEAIRVTQTDISINPKISDPTLSDIQITSNCDCVKLIREQFRQVSKTSIDSDTNGNINENDDRIEICNQPSTSSIYVKRDKMVNPKKSTENVEVQSELDLQDQQTQGSYGDGTDYTIPIQGTNMTLKVSVGSNPITNMEVFDSKGLGRPLDSIDSNEMIGICYNNLETDEVCTAENVSTLAEDFSKFVQSETKDVFSQYERKTRTFNTICTQGNASNMERPQRKQLLRSNTCDCIEEGTGECRKKTIDDFFNQDKWSTYPKISERKVNSIRGPLYPEGREYVDSGSSQNDLNDPCPCPESSECRNICGKNAACRKLTPQSTVPVKMVDTACGPMSGINLEPCPCPENSPCGNVCDEHAECRKKSSASQKPVTVRKIEPLGSNKEIDCSPSKKKIPCPCPVPSECGNLCDKNAKCWSNVRSVSIGTPFETPKIPEVKKREKLPCSCPNSAKCGGYCGKDAICRKKTEVPEPRRIPEPRSVPPSPRKTPCSCPNSAKCGGFCGKDASCRKQTISSECLKPSTQKSPCDCPNSAACKGFCKSDAACRKPKANSSGSNRGSEPYGDSPPENSDSDYADFKKLKTYLRAQTYPLQAKSSISSRSPSLPSNITKPILPTEEVESPSEDRIIPSPSKLQTSDSNDLIMNVIKDVTNRYSKKDLGKSQKKKCFIEIMSIMNYLLDTEEVTSNDALKGLRDLVVESSSSESIACVQKKETPNLIMPLGASTSRGTCTDNVKKKDCMTKPSDDCCEKKTCDKGVQLSDKKSKPGKCCPESSDFPISSEIPCTSSDSVTCEVLNKIRNECEKYHRKCCKRHQSPKRCQCSSTTSMSCDQCKRITMCQCRSISANCDQCKRVHHCQCRPHNRCKCKGYRPKNIYEKTKKKCVAYNLIIQTSESMVGEKCEQNCRPLKNIIVKVPPRKPSACNVPFKELECEIEKQASSPSNEGRNYRSKSLPNDSISSTDEGLKATLFTVKDYLEKNRPDFIEQSGHRQKCLKMICEASDPCGSCSACCESCEPCSPPVKRTIIIHNSSTATSPRCAPPCTLFCRGVQMGCDPYKSNSCKPCDPCRPSSPCETYDPCNSCGPCKPCNTFDPCNPCVDTNQMQVTTIGECYSMRLIICGSDVLLYSYTPRLKRPVRSIGGLKISNLLRAANNRSAQRELLSMQVQMEPTLRSLSESDLRAFARELGFNLRHRKEPPKLISEREMKNHSRKIYKKLPEVVQKKENLKKENIKKTNLLLAYIFKKNLQKQVLRGTVDLSNYNTVIKI